MNNGAKILNKILTNRIEKCIFKMYTLWPSGIYYSTYAELVQYLKINQYNLPHQHTKEETSYDQMQKEHSTKSNTHL